MTQCPGNSQGLVVGAYSNDADELNENKKKVSKVPAFRETGLTLISNLKWAQRLGTWEEHRPAVRHHPTLCLSH